jgi:hypothetical protein
MQKPLACRGGQQHCPSSTLHLSAVPELTRWPATSQQDSPRLLQHWHSLQSRCITQSLADMPAAAAAVHAAAAKQLPVSHCSQCLVRAVYCS